MKHNLTLVRKTDDDAIVRGTAADAGKVRLDKISWFMPHVIPADAEKFSIYKTIESKVKVPVAYIERDNVICYQFLNRQFYMATERKDSSGETEIYYCWFPNG